MESGGEANLVGSVWDASGTVEKSNSAATSDVAFCVANRKIDVSRRLLRPSRFCQLCLGGYFVLAWVSVSSFRSKRLLLLMSPRYLVLGECPSLLLTDGGVPRRNFLSRFCK